MSTTTNLSVALVTGARGGIGREVVTRLRAVGHRVAALGRDAATLSAVEADAHIPADATTPEGAAAAVAECTRQLGSVPALLAHCVGSTLIVPLHRTSAAQYREVLRINLDSAVFMLQAWIEAMRDAGTPGSAVLVSAWPTTRRSPRPKVASRHWRVGPRRPTHQSVCASTR